VSTSATPSGPGCGQARSILREARFVRLWLGTTASGLATWALPFVLGLGLELTGMVDTWVS
jgi:hypothetical protein